MASGVSSIYSSDRVSMLRRDGEPIRLDVLIEYTWAADLDGSRHFLFFNCPVQLLVPKADLNIC